MDWEAFLTDHDVPYVTRGPNTKKGEVSIKCPWCGDDDPSEHLGISLTHELWGCYRNAMHRGMAAHRLISGITGLPSDRARALARAYSRPNPDGLGEALAKLTRTSEPRKASDLEVVKYPLEFRGIRPSGITKRFWQYLRNRHFDDVEDLIERYGLLCCMTGRWSYRVIIPLHKGGNLVGWTGRVIVPAANSPRYLSSGDVIKKLVWNEDELEGGKLLFITEGPFDALKLDYYGEPQGVRATCLFGTSFSMDQICTLRMLRRRFRKVVVLLDREAVQPAFQLADWIQGPNVSVATMPELFKDPGQMKWPDVNALIRREI